MIRAFLDVLRLFTSAPHTFVTNEKSRLIQWKLTIFYGTRYRAFINDSIILSRRDWHALNSDMRKLLFLRPRTFARTRKTRKREREKERLRAASFFLSLSRLVSRVWHFRVNTVTSLAFKTITRRAVITAAPGIPRRRRRRRRRRHQSVRNHDGIVSRSDTGLNNKAESEAREKISPCRGL